MESENPKHKPRASRDRRMPRVLVETFKVSETERAEIAAAAERAQKGRSVFERDAVLAEARRADAA